MAIVGEQNSAAPPPFAWLRNKPMIRPSKVNFRRFDIRLLETNFEFLRQIKCKPGGGVLARMSTGHGHTGHGDHQGIRAGLRDIDIAASRMRKSLTLGRRGSLPRSQCDGD